MYEIESDKGNWRSELKKGRQGMNEVKWEMDPRLANYYKAMGKARVDEIKEELREYRLDGPDKDITWMPFMIECIENGALGELTKPEININLFKDQIQVEFYSSPISEVKATEFAMTMGDWQIAQATTARRMQIRVPIYGRDGLQRLLEVTSHSAFEEDEMLGIRLMSLAGRSESANTIFNGASTLTIDYEFKNNPIYNSMGELQEIMEDTMAGNINLDVNLTRYGSSCSKTTYQLLKRNVLNDCFQDAMPYRFGLALEEDNIDKEHLKVIDEPITRNERVHVNETLEETRPMAPELRDLIERINGDLGTDYKILPREENYKSYSKIANKNIHDNTQIKTPEEFAVKDFLQGLYGEAPGPIKPNDIEWSYITELNQLLLETYSANYLLNHSKELKEVKLYLNKNNELIGLDDFLDIRMPFHEESYLQVYINAFNPVEIRDEAKNNKRR